MKEFPLTEGELRELGAVGVLATFFFAMGTGCLGFALNVSQNIAFASNIPANIAHFWEALRVAAFIAIPIFYVLGAVLFLYTGNRVRKIKRETEHDD